MPKLTDSFFYKRTLTIAMSMKHKRQDEITLKYVTNLSLPRIHLSNDILRSFKK